MYDPEYFPPYDVIIDYDGNNGDPVRYIIHELLHVVFSPLFAGHIDDTLDEVLIVALDQYMWSYVKESKARFAKWNALIEQKIEAADKEAGVKPTPLKELVDRP